MNAIRFNRISFVFGVIVSACIPVLLFSNNLLAKWWLIDDHELFNFAGSIEHQYSFLDFFSTLFDKTEVGSFLQSPRYRPSYYILRLLELSFFGLNPTLYYIFRLFIAIFFSLSVFYFLNKYLYSFVSLILVLVVWSYHFWSDIFSRMGPAEIYGTLGLAFLLTSFSVSHKRKLLSSYLRVIALLILLGTKENFLFFSLLSVFAIFQMMRYRKRKLLFYLLEFLPILYAFIITISLFGFYESTGDNVYGNTVNIYERFGLIFRLFSDKIFVALSVIVFLICCFILFVKGFLIRFIEYIFIIVFCFGIYVSNFIFYHAEWPTGMRYDFPGIFLFPVVLIMFFRVMLLHYEIQIKTQIFLLFLTSFIQVNYYGLKHNLESSIENSLRTNKFSEFLNKVVSDLKENPEKEIVIRVTTAWDYEPYHALMVFYRYYGIRNNILVRVDPMSNPTLFEKQLFDSLANLEKLNVYPKSGCLVQSFRDLKPRAFCKDQSDQTVPW